MRSVHRPDRGTLFDHLGLMLGGGAVLAVVAGQAYFVAILLLQP
jgi:hypothetical protein